MTRLHELAYFQHITVAPAYDGDEFEAEIDKGHERYYQMVRVMAPWLQITGPMKSPAEAWADLQERRKDPAHMAWVAREQKLLDERAAQYTAAVTEQLKLAQEAKEWEKQRRAALKKPVGKRYVRLPKGRRKGRR